MMVLVPATIFLTALLPSFVEPRLQYNVVGWYDLRPQFVAAVPVSSINFTALTHLVVGRPNISVDGTMSCEPYSESNITSQLRRLATKHGVKMQLVISDDTAHLLNNSDVKSNFLNGLPAAMKRCECDGVEFDFEPGNDATPATFDVSINVFVSKWTNFISVFRTVM